MSNRRLPLVALFVATLPGTAFVPSPGHAADSGATLFARYCFTCHALERDRIKTGPPLHAVVGRPAASESRFLYSRAMRASGLVWTEDTLDAFLTSPRTLVPGTMMVTEGVPDPAIRAALIDYLKAN